MNFYRNTEGYSDPTAGKALSNIFRKERRARRNGGKKRKAAVREHALSNNVEKPTSTIDGSLSDAG